MKLYHFTQCINVPSIRANGIRVGNVPFQEKGVSRQVSLTSQLNPLGHGLFLGQVLEESDQQFKYLAGCFPNCLMGTAPNRKLKLHDQSEVALELNISRQDPKLVDFHAFIVDALDTMKKLRSVDNIALAKATVIASCRYPMGFPPGVDISQVTDEVLKIRQSKATWYFYKTDVPPQKIGRAITRNSDGEYMNDTLPYDLYAAANTNPGPAI